MILYSTSIVSWTSLARMVLRQIQLFLFGQVIVEIIRCTNLFREAGNKIYQNILPLEDPCVYLVPDYRRNMPKPLPGTGILQLEVIFNLLFGNHDLANKNHRALPDALQLRLMAKLFIKLCKHQNKDSLVYFLDLSTNIF